MFLEAPEDRPVFLVVVLLLYFLIGIFAMFSGLLAVVIRGISVGAIALDLAVAAFTSVSAFAAWRHVRLGYFGVVVAGA